MTSNANWELKIDEEVYTTLKKLPSAVAQGMVRMIGEISLESFRGSRKVGRDDNSWCHQKGTSFIFYDVDRSFRFIHITDIDSRPE